MYDAASLELPALNPVKACNPRFKETYFEVQGSSARTGITKARPIPGDVGCLWLGYNDIHNWNIISWNLQVGEPLHYRALHSSQLV